MALACLAYLIHSLFLSHLRLQVHGPTYGKLVWKTVDLYLALVSCQSIVLKTSATLTFDSFVAGVNSMHKLSSNTAWSDLRASVGVEAGCLGTINLDLIVLNKCAQRSG